MIYAVGVNDVVGTINPGPMGNLNFSGVFSWAVSLFFFGAGMFALFQLFLGAFEWISSGGEEKKLGDSRKKIMSATIGLVMCIVIFVLWNFVVGPILGIFKNGQLQLPTVNSMCVGKGNTAAAASDCCSGILDPAGTGKCL
jgi:hypothetical protein